MHPILSNNTIIFAFINIFFLEGGDDAKCEPPDVYVAIQYVANHHRQSEEAEDGHHHQKIPLILEG